MPRLSAISVRKCQIKNGHIVAKGDIIFLNLDKAFELLAPSKTPMAKMNVLNVRTGNYITIKPNNINARFINRTNDGDIRWFIKKNPEFEYSIKEVYRVEDIVLINTAKDLPGDVERV